MHGMNNIAATCIYGSIVIFILHLWQWKWNGNGISLLLLQNIIINRALYGYLEIKNVSSQWTWDTCTVSMLISLAGCIQLWNAFQLWYFLAAMYSVWYPLSPWTYIYVICRPGGPYWEKLCPRSWVRPKAAGRGPCSRSRAQFFPIRTDLSRQITCLFFLSGKLLYTEYLCLFFTEAVSHHVRAFDVSVKQTCVVYKVFKRRDSVFTDFRTEQWRIYIS